MEMVIYLALVLAGLCLGSFAGATVWRLRARQLADDKKRREPVDAKEYERLKPLMSAKVSSDHSRCLHCGKRLRWFDLIPLASWVFLRGKCRQCHKPIGLMEPLIELGVAVFFVISYLFWPFALDAPLEIGRFIIWLVAGVLLAMLFAYDSKWFLLPDKVVVPFIGLGVISIAIMAVQSGSPTGTLLSALGGIGILSGLYLGLYLLSKGKWIGFGDVKLGAGLALLLGDWQLALVALFLANFVGCLIVIPMLAAKKLERSAHVPFGPLLIIGMILAQFIGPAIVANYLVIFL